MKWWYYLILEILILFGIMAWIYFVPDELELNIAKSFFGFTTVYIIESLRSR